MKKLLLLAILCWLGAAAFAQTAPQTLTVKGVTIDSVTNKPLGYVTVVLLNPDTQQPVRSSITKDDGSFELKAPTSKAYLLSFVSIGYKNKSIKIPAGTADIDEGRLMISPSSKELKEVSVTAARPIMKQEVDRISYDVQADPESKALTALDMMRKVPLLSVDADENIKMKGSTSYKILINGRESALMAKSPSDVLKAMPADNIEKIEVITTPPAKYDAEGLTGIINIITKKNADQGYNANISGRYNSVFGPGLYGHASVKEGKLGVSVFVGTNHNSGFTAGSGNSQTIFGGQRISQTGTNDNKYQNYFGTAELSYEIDTLNLLTASFQTYHGKGTQSSDQFSNTLNNDGSIAQQYDQMSSGYGKNQGMDATINYQLGFKHSKDQLLTLSYKFSYSPNINYTNDLFSQRLNDYESEQPDFNQ
jgi:outer membrane cobalamin receptor